MAMASKKPFKALVIMGSVREGRMCERVTTFVANKLREAKYDVEVCDPDILNLPVLKKPIHFYADQSQVPQVLRELNETIKNADALVLITPEYNRQMSAALTNLLDHFPPILYAYKASAIVWYSIGGILGLTSAAQARTLMVEMGALPIPFLLKIPLVALSLDESGNANDEHLHKQASKMITQLDWYTEAFRNQRQLGIPKWEGITVSKTVVL